MLSRIRVFGWTILIAMIISFGLTLAQAVPAQAQDNQPENVVIYFFRRDGCPHCAEEEPFLEAIARENPTVEIRNFEISKFPENRERYQTMADAYGFQAQYVPATFIGDRYWIGFNEEIGKEIKDAVAACLTTSCSDASKYRNPDLIKLPIFGSVNLGKQSLLVSTLIISFVDGFNPCSLWVLSMLLALVLHTGSRKKIFIVGLVFLTVTAAVYGLFIAGLFSVLSIFSYLWWIQILVAVVALVFAIINIKDYFWYKEGISLTISDKHKPGIFQNIRRIMDSSQSMWALISATVIMAAGVSLVEFSCTAGFPVVWTNLLSAHQVDTVTFVLLLLVYMVVYQLDEIVIFLSAVYSLKASRLEEKEGRILKLVGGMLMLTLAAVMIVNPNLMNSISSSLIIFGIAFGSAILILLLHRIILPKFGIVIGTEKLGGKSGTRRKPGSDRTFRRQSR